MSKKRFSQRFDLFLYKNEYQILEIAGVLSGLFIIFIANSLYYSQSFYYFLFFFGLMIGCLGFTVEYLIKSDKRKTIESEFSYFLADLGREYKKTKNLNVALKSVSDNNFYGSINEDIKKLANRVSWGESFESALSSMNQSIKSKVVNHVLLLLNVLKDTSIPYDKLLINLSKDTTVFKLERTSEKYFNNLFILSFVFYFIFVFLLLFMDFTIGQNFLWFSISNEITRLFLSNFLLYLALILSVFTSFVMCVIKQKKPISFFKYLFIFFVITVILFQIFVPKPDATDMLVNGIDYLSQADESTLNLTRIIGVKSIFAEEIIEKTSAEKIYFIKKNQISCGIDCSTQNVILENVVFLNFEIIKQQKEYFIYYEVID